MSEPKFIVKFNEPRNVMESFDWHPSIDPPPPVTKKEALKQFAFVRAVMDSFAKLEGKWHVSRVRIENVETGDVKLVAYPGQEAQGPWAMKLSTKKAA